MKKILFFLLTVLYAHVFLFSQEKQTLIFSDNFDNYQNGSDGTPVWMPVKGDWKIIDGVYIQRSYDYDCGSMIKKFLKGRYACEVKVKNLHGTPGAGLFFNSASCENTLFSQMTRFESMQSMMMGKFSPTGYDASSVVRIELGDKSWHALKVIVDGNKSIYSVFLDGKNVAENIRLYNNAGFPGLQSSGCECAFDDFRIYKFDDKSETPTMHWISDFTFNADGKIIIPDQINGTVNTFDKSGRIMRQTGVPANKRGQLSEPSLVALGTSGEIIVYDKAKHKIHTFSENGVWKNSFGSKGEGRSDFNNPAALMVDDEGNILVLDGSVKVFNREGSFIIEFGKNKLRNPSDLRIGEGKIYVVNRDEFKIEIYLWDGERAEWISSVDYDHGNCRGITVKNNCFFLSIENSVKKIDYEGKYLADYTCSTIGYFYPLKLAYNPDGKLYIADYSGGRLLVTDDNLTETEVKIELKNLDDVVLAWETTEPLRSQIEVRKNGKMFFQKESDDKTRVHCYELKDLGFSENYRFRIKPAVESIPAFDGFSQEYSFTTGAGKSKKQYWYFPAAALIFTNVYDKDKMKESYPELPPLEQAEIDRLKKQIEQAERFYWFTSNLNFHLDIDVILIDEKLERGEVFDDSPYYYPLKPVINKYITAAGKKVNDYYGILYMACVRDYDEEKEKYILRGRGGAFTEGLNTGDGYGISWWEVTRKNHNSGNNWLITHEFNHQIDILFLNAGHPEYWFNHFNPNIGTAAKFSEHFDGNAYIMRMVPQMHWYDFKSGELRVTTDVDEDGIPDDEPELPADEKRLGSNPEAVDTDKDGLSDFEEITISNWIVEGVEETYGGKRLFPDLNNPDTDGDGLEDGVDSCPFYVIDTFIAFGTPVIDGKIEKNEWTHFADFTGEHANAKIFFNWDDKNLYAAIETDGKPLCKIQLDFNANGWFIGRDNYVIKCIERENGDFHYSVDIFNASDLEKWPFIDKELSRDKKINFAYSEDNFRYYTEFAIPKDNTTGINLIPGEKIGLNIGFQTLRGKKENKRYFTIFEPNRLVDVTLVK